MAVTSDSAAVKPSSGLTSAIYPLLFAQTYPNNYPPVCREVCCELAFPPFPFDQHIGSWYSNVTFSVDTHP